MSSISQEYDDDGTSSIGRVVSRFDKGLYGNNEFRNAAKPLLTTSCASKTDIIEASAAVVPDAAPSSNGSFPPKNTMKLQEKIKNQQIMVVPPHVRDAALADLHGVTQYSTEEPSFIASCLERMERRLSEMEGDLIAAYRKCDWKYSHDRTFRLMFLRADSYDPLAAATRFALHFTLKLELFGEHMLSKNITMEDLDEETQKFIKSGYMEPLPMRDRAGRLIIFAKPVPFTRTSLMKSQWFMLMDIVQNDALSQIRGVVIAGYNIGPDFVIDHRVWRDLSFSTRASPIRIASHHCLVHGQENAAMIMSLRYYMKPANFMRFQLYTNKSVDEFHRDMRRFGLPMEAFVRPGQSEYNIVERTQMRFLAKQLYLMKCRAHSERQQLLNGGTDFGDEDQAKWEESSGERKTDLLALWPSKASPARRYGSTGSSDDDRIHELRKNDVIFGKGQSREHHGNLRVQEKVKELSPEYQAGDRSHKTELAEAVVEYVHDSGGRFLKHAEDDIDDLASTIIGGYVEVPHVMAREKITRFFRKFKSRK